MEIKSYIGTKGLLATVEYLNHAQVYLPESLTLDDLFMQLQYINRFNGATGKQYSVLDHTVAGTRLLKNEFDYTDETLCGWIMHDLPETLVQDLVPLGRNLIANETIYESVENAFLRSVFTLFSLGHVDIHAHPVRVLDNLMADAEKSYFGLPFKGINLRKAKTYIREVMEMRAVEKIEYLINNLDRSLDHA